MDQKLANEIPEPSPGRIVHFHHNESQDHKEASNNGAKSVPAIVTQHFNGLKANMTVFPVGMQPITGWSVPHESEKQSGQPYWSWPERM
jgi:hypothetical protein